MLRGVGQALPAPVPPVAGDSALRMASQPGGRSVVVRHGAGGSRGPSTSLLVLLAAAVSVAYVLLAARQLGNAVAAEGDAAEGAGGADGADASGSLRAPDAKPSRAPSAKPKPSGTPSNTPSSTPSPSSTPPPQSLYGLAFDANVVDNVFIFTVARVETPKYAQLLQNWALGVDHAFRSEEVSRKRVIIVPDYASCALLAQIQPKPVLNCIVDTLTPDFYPSVHLPGAGLELLKFQWTAEALTHGHEVLYADADLIFRGMPSAHGQVGAAIAASLWRGDMEAAVDPLRFFRSQREAKGPGAPDLQMMSDHSANLDDVRGSCHGPLMAPTFEFISRSSTGSTWRDATYERAFRPAHLEQPTGATVAVDHAGLVCARGALWAPNAVGGCISMALWFARPAPNVAELFREALNGLRTVHAEAGAVAPPIHAAGDAAGKAAADAARNADVPLGLDQIVFNRAVIAFLTRLKLVLLDVREAGNDIEQECARSLLGSAPPPPIATHYRGPQKDLWMKRGGPDIWRLAPDAPQYQ